MPKISYHIILSTTPLRPKAGDKQGYTPTPFFCDGSTLNEAVRAARVEARARGLVSTYVMAAREIMAPFPI